MGSFSSPAGTFGLTIYGTPQSKLTSGGSTVGQSQFSMPLTDSTFGFACAAVMQHGASLTLNLATGVGTVDDAGVPTLAVSGAVSYSNGSGTNSALPARLLYAGESEGEHAWSSTGTWVPNPALVTAPYVQIEVMPGGTLRLTAVGTGGISTFEAAGTNPLGATWVAAVDETGTPVVVDDPDEAPTSWKDADGKDFEGDTLPTAGAIGGMFMHCLSGSASISIGIAPAFTIPLKAGAMVQYGCPEAESGLLGGLVVFALEENTEVEFAFTAKP